MAKFYFILLYAAALHVLCSSASSLAWEEDAGQQPATRRHRHSKRYIVIPILPGNEGPRDGQGMGNGMSQQSGNYKGTADWDEENFEEDEHIGEKPNSVEAAARRGEKLRGKPAINGRHGRARREGRLNRWDLLDEILQSD